MKRSAGILLPISSLPSNYGIGTLGKAAYEFVDFLVDAKQTYWQVLPVGPTSYGDSPYQSFSSFAGNPYFIDLDLLIEDGLISKKDISKLENYDYINYEYLYNTRFDILKIAYINGINKYNLEFNEFKKTNGKWLDDYVLFMSLKKCFNMVSWTEWDIDIKKRESKTLEYYRNKLKEDIDFYSFIQFLFYKQYSDVKKYANDNGISIIGDMPIYVALDSCDIWANPDEFLLDKQTYLPTDVAGVPPDYFCEDGQLWGNPLYDWKHMKTNGYKWWIERIAGISKYFDVIRIDHFRAFEQFWAVPYGSKNAIKGKWIDGPSLDFVSTVTSWFNNTKFIAEDLGDIDDSVRKLVVDSHLPGMRVLEFSIDGRSDNCHLPHNYINNCVCYVGTHDNVPVNGWIKTLNRNELKQAKDYYGLTKNEGYNIGLIRNGMGSVADTFICQIQDYLGLDENATINRPGTLNNWRWRLTKGQIDDNLAKFIGEITKRYSR